MVDKAAAGSSQVPLVLFSRWLPNMVAGKRDGPSKLHKKQEQSGPEDCSETTRFLDKP